MVRCHILIQLGLLVCVASKTMYPWGGIDAAERSEDILEAVRKSLTLEVFQDTISKSLKENGVDKLFMKNSEGVTFTAKLQTPDTTVNIVDDSVHNEIYTIDDFLKKMGLVR